jgi:hypothetical protein
MKTYYLKIRDKFIQDIKNRTKKHEYRLASPERMQAKVGDTFVLISNQNKGNFVRTTIKGIKTYKTWREALEKNWEQDFKNLFSSIEDTLKECYKFYTKEEVDKYGIVVFEIEPLYVDYSKASVLIDTNIFIKRESSNNVTFEINSLFKWFDKKHIKKYIHNSTVEELKTYKDEKVKNTMLTKINSYDILPSFKMETDRYFEYIVSLYAKDANSKIDNILLKEVYNDNVGLLLTDDAAILKKAQDLYIRDKVLTSSELLEIFEKAYPKNIEYKMLAVQLKRFDEVDINSSFFDTLREDYGGKDFDDWFKKKGNEKAYVFENNEKELKGFLYLKIEDENENYSDIEPILTPKRRLKVGTFKIERTGFRLGERFLKIIFENATKWDVDEVYVTLFEDKRNGVIALKNTMEQWGFVKHGYKKSNGELVLVKDMRHYNIKESPKFNYPILKPEKNHFFLPIYPQYHTDLFPDNILKSEDMRLYEDKLAHRYAIEKIYLTGAFDIRAKPGDVILIYRVGEGLYKNYSSVVTGMAIVQEVVETKNVEECIGICKDKSIFREEDIRKVYSKYPVVLKLLDYKPFTHKVTLSELRNNNIIDKHSGPRPFNYVTKEEFEIIYKLGMEE